MAADALAVRVEDVARRIHNVENDLRANPPAVSAVQISGLREDVAELGNEVRGLRRAVIGFAITVAASAVGFALTVILVWGGQ